MPRTVRLALLALATVLLATGCATTVPGLAAPSAAASSAAATATATADPVAWVNKVCGSLLPFVKAASTRPTVNPSDPRAALKGSSAYLGGVATSLDTALAQLKEVGPAPIQGGDDVVTTLTSALTPIRASVRDAKAKVDAADPNDPLAAAAALTAAAQSLKGLADLQKSPSADLQDQPALRQAARQAPNCKVLGIGS